MRSWQPRHETKCCRKARTKALFADQMALSVRLLPADWDVSLLEQGARSFFPKLLRMDKMRLAGANVLHVRREPRHQWISFAARSVCLSHLAESLGRNFDQVNMSIALQLGLVGNAVPSDLMHVMRRDAQAAPVARPEADLVQGDTHKTLFSMLLRPVASVFQFMRALHWLGACRCSRIHAAKGVRNAHA